MITNRRLNSLIRQYHNVGYSVTNDQWIKFVKGQRGNFFTVLRAAILSIDGNGNLHPHQYRVGAIRLSNFMSFVNASHISYLLYNKLTDNKTTKFNSRIGFDYVHEKIKEAAEKSGITRLGVLTVYDITCRICATYNLEPKKVYLHNGTLTGARRLGLVPRGKRVLEFGDILYSRHADLLKLKKMRDIENFLCIYKDEF